MVRITHLEITSKDQWVRRTREGTGIEVRECVIKQPRFNRFLYKYVGGDWRWLYDERQPALSHVGLDYSVSADEQVHGEVPVIVDDDGWLSEVKPKAAHSFWADLTRGA